MQTKQTHNKEKLAAFARLKQISEIRKAIRTLHAAEIADILEELPYEYQLLIIRDLPRDQASEVLSELDEETEPENILSALPTEQAVQLLENLDSDDIVDLIAKIPEDKKILLLSKMDKESADELKFLLEYPEESAGGLMNPDVIKVNAKLTKKEAVKEIILQSEDMENFYYIYVVDDYDHLMGIVSVKDLMRAKPETIIENITQTDIIAVNSHTDQEAVAKIMSQYNLPTLPVVDLANQLIGRITFDDIMDVMEEESTEDILRMSGVSDEEKLRGTWFEAIKSRLPWLMVNLFSALASAYVISLFDSTIEKLVIITSYLPVIAGMGGNAATQTLAVTIRRISLNESSRSEYKIIVKEVLTGAFNGFVIGTIISLAAIFFNQSPMLGVVVFLAMFGNITLAGFAGAFIPLMLQRWKVDPAIASSIFITAITDIIGFSVLLGLATALLL